jgi:hypothetical protein
MHGAIGKPPMESFDRFYWMMGGTDGRHFTANGSESHREPGRVRASVRVRQQDSNGHTLLGFSINSVISPDLFAINVLT